MEKRKILGIPLALFVIGILVLGGATASLVSYLSNTVNMETTVSSPLEMTGDVAMDLTMEGGEDIVYSVTTKNLADVAITSYPVTTLTAPTGTVFTGNEFTKIVYGRDNLNNGVGYEAGEDMIDITSAMCYLTESGAIGLFTNVGALNLNKVNIVFNAGCGSAPVWTRAVGFNELNHMEITTNQALASGKYLIQSCQLYEAKGFC